MAGPSVSGVTIAADSSGPCKQWVNYSICQNFFPHSAMILLLTTGARINIDRKEISREIWGKIGESLTDDCPDVIWSLCKTRLPPYVMSFWNEGTTF